MSKQTNYFIHPLSIVETQNIGEESRIWAFTHVMDNVKIGSGCNIGEGCFIESGVVIGNDVVIKNNISIWNGVKIEDGAFIGPNVVFTNELEPRSGFPKDLAHTLIKIGASVGANATVVANRIIGEYAMIGAGSVVTKDIIPQRLVYGNPATERGWVCLCGRKLVFTEISAKCICTRRFILKEGKIIKST